MHAHSCLIKIGIAGRIQYCDGINYFCREGFTCMNNECFKSYKGTHDPNFKSNHSSCTGRRPYGCPKGSYCLRQAHKSAEPQCVTRLDFCGQQELCKENQVCPIKIPLLYCLNYCNSRLASMVTATMAKTVLQIPTPFARSLIFAAAPVA